MHKALLTEHVLSLWTEHVLSLLTEHVLFLLGAKNICLFCKEERTTDVRTCSFSFAKKKKQQMFSLIGLSGKRDLYF